MRLFQTSMSSTRVAGTLCNITFQTYRTPNSTKPTEDIVFRVLRNNYAKMRSTGTFTADPRNYSFTASPNLTQVNSRTQWQLVFTLADPLAPSGYLTLTIPPQLTRSNFSVTLSSSISDINTLPTVTFLNSTALSLTNLNRTSALIPSQTITITLIGLTMPASAQPIGSWGLAVYYSSENYLNANGLQTNSVSATNGVLTGARVVAGVDVTAAQSDLLLGFVVGNGVPVGGRLELGVPVGEVAVGAGPVCVMVSPVATPLVCVMNGLVLSVTIPQIIPAGSVVNITISSITTPRSTLPTSTFTLRTLDNNGLLIDVLSGPLTLAVTQPNLLSTVVTRQSSKNS